MAEEPPTQEQKAEARFEAEVERRRLDVFAGSRRCPRVVVRPFPPDPAVVSSDVLSAIRASADGSPDASRRLFSEDDPPPQPAQGRPRHRAACGPFVRLFTKPWSLVWWLCSGLWAGLSWLWQCRLTLWVGAFLMSHLRALLSRCGPGLRFAVAFALYQSEASSARLLDKLRPVLTPHAVLLGLAMWSLRRMLPADFVISFQRLVHKLLGLALWIGALTLTLWCIWKNYRCELLQCARYLKSLAFSYTAGRTAESFAIELFGEGSLSKAVGWTSSALAGYAGHWFFSKETDPLCISSDAPLEEDESFVNRGLQRLVHRALGTADRGLLKPSNLTRARIPASSPEAAPRSLSLPSWELGWRSDALPPDGAVVADTSAAIPAPPVQQTPPGGPPSADVDGPTPRLPPRPCLRIQRRLRGRGCDLPHPCPAASRLGKSRAPDARHSRRRTSRARHRLPGRSRQQYYIFNTHDDRPPRLYGGGVTPEFPACRGNSGLGPWCRLCNIINIIVRPPCYGCRQPECTPAPGLPRRNGRSRLTCLALPHVFPVVRVDSHVRT